MGFLAPAFLALAAFAGVPLLVHLLRRRVARTVEFPAVRYLARMEQEHSRELKLRNRLLLLLRLLAVMALALAAARPIVRWLGIGHAPIAVAVVVDNSMSSGLVRDGRMVFDSVRRDARSVIDALTPDDRGWLVTADGRVFGGTSSALAAALDALSPLGGRGDLAAATRRAVALAQSGAPRTPVVALVSDGQRSSFLADSVVDAGRVPVVAWLHSSATPVRNAAVLAAGASPMRWAPGGTVTMAIASPDSASWRLSLDQRTVARGRVTAAPIDAPAQLSLKLSSASTGWMRGHVELDADALHADDSRWFAVRVAPPPAVDARGTAGPFLDAALSTLVDEGRLIRQPRGAVSTTVASAETEGTGLPVLLVAPADPVRVGEANRQLARLNIPWRFGAIARSPVVARVPGAASDSTAPSVQAFEGTTVRLRYPLVAAGRAQDATARIGTGATDTIATAGGAPWVVAGAGYVLIGSPIDLSATDLPLRAAFVPWVLDGLARRLGEDGRVISAVPGAIVTGLRDVDALERPDGARQPLAGDRLTVPQQPGVYFLRRDSARVGALVVNSEPEESDVVGMGGESGTVDSAMATFVRGADVVAMREASAWRTAIFDRAAGQALVLPLIALALLALLAEAWISGR